MNWLDGQQRRAWLDQKTADAANALRYYMGPGFSDFGGNVLKAASYMNPVNDIGEAMAAGRDGEYVNMLTHTATAAAPVVAGKIAKAYNPRMADDAAQWLEDALMGVSVNPTAASLKAAPGQFVADESGVFAGPKALTADKSALDKAIQMTDAGASRDDIWRETGWFQGVDGKWRFEIDDTSFDIRPNWATDEMAQDMRREAKILLDGVNARNADLKTQPDLFPADLRKANGNVRREAKRLRAEAESNFGPEWNPETIGQRAVYAFGTPINEAYPEMMRDTVARTGERMTARGSYDEAGKSLRVASDLTGDDRRSTALHELQHAIQAQEGFARGGNVGMGYDFRMDADREIGRINERLGEVVREIDKIKAQNHLGGYRPNHTDLAPLYDEYDRLQDAKSPLINASIRPAEDYYLSLAGEAEARNVQNRYLARLRGEVPGAPWETMTKPEVNSMGATGKDLPLSEDDLIVRMSAPGAASNSEATLAPPQQQAQDVLDLLSAGRADEVTDDMLAAADDLYLFENYDLPMDAMNRHYRASKMGIEIEPLGGRPSKETMYHQTPADIQAFELGRNGDGVSSGHSGGGAIWTSETPHRIPAAHNTIDERTGEYLDGVNIMPVVGRQGKRVGINEKWDPDYGINEQFPNVVTMAENARLSSEGFTHGSTGIEKAFFDPRNIRSRFARFDPRLKHLANLSAAGAGVAYLTPQEEAEIRAYLGE